MKNCTVCDKEFSYKGTKCYNCHSRIRRFNNKVKGIQLLGGKCSRCGYNSHMAALEFHHPDDNKVFNLGNFMNAKWEKLEIEIKKCELLCSNCHAIEHNKYHETETLIKNFNNENKSI